MEINLNDGDLTIDDVRKLIASKDDTFSRQIRITDDGILFLSDDVGNLNLDGICFRMETFCSGTDHVGKAAAADEHWVRSVYNAIKSNWPEPTTSFISIF